MSIHQNVTVDNRAERMKLRVPRVSHMPAAQLSAYIVHLFVGNSGTNLSFLPPVFLPAAAVISNNPCFYKQPSIICTAALGVILKPPIHRAGFNLSRGFQTHSPVGLTAFPTFDKLPISLGFAISALFPRVCVGLFVRPVNYSSLHRR